MTTQCLLQVTVHLSKLFDSMSDLEFAKNEQVDNPKLAVAMYSKEREFVPFQTECCCYGPVRLHPLSNKLNELNCHVSSDKFINGKKKILLH